MTQPVIAIIGAGNMGGSLVTGLIHHDYPANAIWATDPSQEKCDHFQKTFNIHTSTDNKKAISVANIVLFAIKPQIYAQVAMDVREIIQNRKPLVISIAAGIRIQRIQTWLGKHLPIIRAMPNTPALIGDGAIALFATEEVTKTHRALAESILQSVGIITWLPTESLMDIVTALSGSGPAYFFMVMEALEEAAIAHGLPAETAHLLTLQTALGAARLAMKSDLSLEMLRKQVTSPGGTTEKAISVLESKFIKTIFADAITAAKTRSEELGQ